MRLNVIVPLNKKSFHRRLVELEKSSIDDICGFLTGEEIKKYLQIKLKNVTVKVIRHPKKKSKLEGFLFSIHIYSETPGFPMTCKCTEIKQGLIESVKQLVAIRPATQGQTTSIMGITPIIAEKFDGKQSE